mmetsp:Transcript_117599/g.366346  ORF Transcript_117599/g.366346 Transcript_117599/m.366346 type:complete len:401 (+) Transcript_117599:380-1582(+)
MAGVEDAVEHALGRGVVLGAAADEAVAELQQVNGVVQAACLAADPGVWHEEVLLHDDRGVAVDHPSEVVHHLDVDEVAVPDGLHDLAGALDVRDEVGAPGVHVDDEALGVLVRGAHRRLQALPELLREARRRRAGSLLSPRVGEQELKAGLGCVGSAPLALGEAAAAGLLLRLQRDEAHAGQLEVADELQERGRGVVQDEDLVPVLVPLLTDDLAVAEACHLPVRVHGAVLQVPLGVLLGKAAGRGPLRDCVLLRDELFVLPPHNGLHAPADLLQHEVLAVGPRDGGPRPVALAEQGLPLVRLLLVEVPPLRPRRGPADSLRAQAGPEVLIEATRLGDALPVRLGLGARAVDHDDLPVMAGEGLPEVQGELVLLRGGVAEGVGRLAVAVGHKERLFVLLL